MAKCKALMGSAVKGLIFTKRVIDKLHHNDHSVCVCAPVGGGECHPGIVDVH